MNRVLNDITNVNYIGSLIDKTSESELYSEVTFMFRNHLYYIDYKGILIDLTEEKDIKPRDIITEESIKNDLSVESG